MLRLLTAPCDMVPEVISLEGLQHGQPEEITSEIETVDDLGIYEASGMVRFRVTFWKN